jgi:hypothetical protein
MGWNPFARRRTPSTQVGLLPSPWTGLNPKPRHYDEMSDDDPEHPHNMWVDEFAKADEAALKRFSEIQTRFKSIQQRVASGRVF